MQQISQEKQDLWRARRTENQKRGGGGGKGREMSGSAVRWERMNPASRGGETSDLGPAWGVQWECRGGLSKLVSVSVPQFCGDWILGRQRTNSEPSILALYSLEDCVGQDP